MTTPSGMAVLLVAVTIAMILAIMTLPSITRQRGGRAFAFFPLFILPLVAVGLGGFRHLEQSKRTEFCLSCHTMDDHGQSLYVDSSSFLPAQHFQNHRVPADQACYACHTDYSMYGDFKAKWRGLNHVYVQYLGKIPAASEIRLYEPYHNRECLHCHEGARSFEEGAVHTIDPKTLPAIKANEMSCLSSGCHDMAHGIATLKEQKLWQPEKKND